MKVEHGYWHLTCDDGKSWWPLGPVPDGQTELPAPPACRWLEERSDSWEFGINNYSFQIPKEGTLHIELNTQEELIFTPGQTYTVHYTVTGGDIKTTVTAELENPDGSYNIKKNGNVSGSFVITANVPTVNRVIVTATDGSRITTAAIPVTLKPVFSGKVITVVTPGTLAALLEELSADYDIQSTAELTIIGNLNEGDIQTLNALPNLAILDLENVNLKTLPRVAFQDKTSLVNVKLPKTLKEIGDGAFWGCGGLASITISESVTTIGNSAFTGCSGLTSITIPESVTEIGAWAFYNCSGLTGDLVIPESVTMIEVLAFSNCSGLTSITIPESVTTIGNSAFSGCSGLTSITIPANVTEIGAQAFYNCSGLTSITIPESVTEIGEWAFYSTSSNLEKVYCKASVPPTCLKTSSESWSPTVFANTWTAQLYVPVGSKEAYAAAEDWKDFRNIIEMEF